MFPCLPMESVIYQHFDYTIPPLVLFIFFNKKIVAGMTAGSVKG